MRISDAQWKHHLRLCGVVSPNRRKFRRAESGCAERSAGGNFPVFDGWRGADLGPGTRLGAQGGVPSFRI